jgi:hypothetical protein
MLLARFWKRHCRLLGGSIYVLAIAGAGIALYVVLPPEPRWVLADGPKGVFYAGDGRIATYRLSDGAALGPVQLWDAATCREVGRFLIAEGTFEAHGHDEDGRRFVAIVRGKDAWHIRSVDLKEQREWQAEVQLGVFPTAIFSPRCDFVALRLAHLDLREHSYAIVETASGRIVDQFQVPSDGAEGGWWPAAGSCAGAGACFVVGYRNEDEVNYIRVFDTRTGKTAVIDDAQGLAVSPDSRWLIADRRNDGVWIWDLAASAWHCPLEGAPRGNMAHTINRGYIASSDLRVVSVKRLLSYRSATVHKYATLRVRIGLNGRAFPGLSSLGEGAAFSPDSRLVVWSASSQATRPRSVVFDAAAGKEVWQRRWDDSAGDPMFTPDSRRIVAPRSDQVEVLSAATGEPVLTIPLSDVPEAPPRLTRDGRTMVIALAPPDEPAPWVLQKIFDWLMPRPAAPPVVLSAFDLETGLPLGQLSAEETEEYWLTEDRQSLVMVYHEYNDGRVTQTTIRCWDMPPRKPLRWAVGVPLVLAALLLSLHAGWRRLRRTEIVVQGSAATHKPDGLARDVPR